MMVFSDERVESIAEKILQELKKQGLVKSDVNRSLFFYSVKKGYVRFYKFCEEIEKSVKNKIKSMSNPPVEGTTQYRAVFDKYVSEEWKKY